MSNHEALSTLEATDLCRVHGGEDRGVHTLRTSIGVGPVTAAVDERIERRDYEICLENNRRQSAEAHPDTRNLVERLFNFGVDRNAAARIADERRAQTACLAARH